MPQKSVRVVLRGGLGNQLFQYGAGVALSQNLGAALILDSRLLPKAAATISGVSSWPVQLGEFHHFGSIIRDTNNRPIEAWVRPSVMQLDRLLGDMFPAMLSKLGRFSNEVNAKPKHFFAIRSARSVINSYCNSPSYFSSFGEEIRRSICNLREPSSNFLELIQESLRDKPLAVHIRLGDYTRLGHIYGKFDPEYVRKAISLQFDIKGERPIWLFSDDVKMALSLIGDLGFPIDIKEKLNGISPLETMLIMSKCNGLVASNSSFSWWAAYLAESNSNNAIFPRPFFAPGGPEEPKDWLLPSWIQLGREI